MESFPQENPITDDEDEQTPSKGQIRQDWLPLTLIRVGVGFGFTVVR